MKRATPELRTAAERVLELESGRRASARLPAAVRVSERFRQVLSTLMGVAGFQALLSRAVTLAKADVPGLAALQVSVDGSLEGLSLDAHEGKRQFSDGEVVLVAHFLQLLLTFLGEALMLRLVNDAWPKLSLADLDFDKGTQP